MKVICFDLDDTLFKERAYLLSAYREIAEYAVKLVKSDDDTDLEFSSEQAYAVMLHAYQSGGNAFEALNETLNLQIPVSAYLQLYRNHKPTIQLPDTTQKFLENLIQEDYVLGLITDGRSIQQRHKIEALKLCRYFDNKNIIISEEFGSEKPCEANYRYFMERYPEAEQYIYIGDNPKKDFVTPNHLGWLTLGLKDNGENIHSQSLDYPSVNYPQQWITHWGEVILV